MIHDPLLRDMPVFGAGVRLILGVPVAFATNSNRIAAAIDHLYAAWPLQQDASEGHSTVSIIEDEAASGGPEHGIVYRMPSRQRLLMLAPGGVGVAEINRGLAYGYVTPAFTETMDFSVGFVDALTMALATAHDRYPVHAATLVRNGTPLMLIGRSGSGKSSIAYAARNRGFEVMGEDVAYIQRNPMLRVWCHPGPHRLLGDVRRHFPELEGRSETRLPNGKQKMIVPAESSPVRWVTDPVPIVLVPGERVHLEPLEPGGVAAALSQAPEEGFDLFTDEANAVAELLEARGGWRLHLSSDPYEAVDAIEQLA